MPKVGGKEYKYTPKGIAKAKADAKSKGVSVEYDKKYTNGGIAQGGDGGIDDIPSLLTEGEVVLNDEQQRALEDITGMSSNDLFAKAGVPGFKEGGEVASLSTLEKDKSYREQVEERRAAMIEENKKKKEERKAKREEKKAKRKAKRKARRKERRDTRVDADSSTPHIEHKDAVKELDKISKTTKHHQFKPKTEKTEGGDYPIYKKETESSESFRDAFKAANKKYKAGGDDTFSWQGRNYSSKTKDDIAADKKAKKAKEAEEARAKIITDKELSEALEAKKVEKVDKPIDDFDPKSPFSDDLLPEFNKGGKVGSKSSSESNGLFDFPSRDSRGKK